MNKRRVYWDTSVFLCFLNQDERERAEIGEDILHHAAMDGLQIVTPTYTIAEVIRPNKRSLPAATRLSTDQATRIKEMFRWPFIRTIELDQRTALYASDLAREYRLNPADAVHAASALLWKADELQAWDRDFTAVSQLIPVSHPVRISPQMTLEGIANRRYAPHPDEFRSSAEVVVRRKDEDDPH